MLSSRDQLEIGVGNIATSRDRGFQACGRIDTCCTLSNPPSRSGEPRPGLNDHHLRQFARVCYRVQHHGLVPSPIRRQPRLCWVVPTPRKFSLARKLHHSRPTTPSMISIHASELLSLSADKVPAFRVQALKSHVCCKGT